ncbi:MAG: hypothetical protein EOP84_11075 [Verrucomicrobiaceae bacterium]|nr:MAG: hypothetical protein EOP84_11075 [Verrucomicrobiaceae bacterium]
MFGNSSRSQRSSGGSPLQVSLLVLVYAAIHSLLASRYAKEAVERLAGKRTRNGLYRSGFIVQSVVATVWAIWRFQKLPDRDLYCVPKPWSWLWRAMQAASVALLASALHTVEIRRILGLPQLGAYLKGGTPEPEPEAQGPALAPDGRIDARGPFRYIRHPDNLPIITLLWSFRRMTVNRLTLACLSTVYAILGSWHEDSRMRRRYGRPFEEYKRTMPMLLPRHGGSKRLSA